MDRPESAGTAPVCHITRLCHCLAQTVCGCLYLAHLQFRALLMASHYGYLKNVQCAIWKCTIWTCRWWHCSSCKAYITICNKIQLHKLGPKPQGQFRTWTRGRLEDTHNRPWCCPGALLNTALLFQFQRTDLQIYNLSFWELPGFIRNI